MEYGYIRVSSREQNIARQMDAIIGFDIEEKCIFYKSSPARTLTVPPTAK